MKKKVKILTILLFINLAVIWGNSLLPGSVSGNISDFVKNTISKMLVFFPDEGNSSGGISIRKLGHFTEFMCLGILLHARYVCIRLWKENKKSYQGISEFVKNKDLISLVMFPGIMVALVDETIQLFIPGRCGVISDVWIDASGMLTGFLITVIFIIVKNSK